jgi:hypothetical protein
MARLGVAQALLAGGRVHIDDVEFDFADPSFADVGEPADRDDLPTSGDQHGVEIDEALVLHTLRVRGFVTPDGFVESIGRHPSELLVGLVELGHVRHIEARDMYGLLPPGKERHAALLDEIADADVRTALAAHYDRFLELNDEFKQICTAWQMRDGEPNDHTDADYDQACVAKLAGLAAAAAPVIDDFASALPRIGRYGARLAAAAARVVSGETKQFTGVMCESFHDIWMELHEDLIALQRIDRVEEGSF